MSIIVIITIFIMFRVYYYYHHHHHRPLHMKPADNKSFHAGCVSCFNQTLDSERFKGTFILF